MQKYVNFWGNFSRHNLIIMYTKTHQTAPYFQFFSGELAYALETPSICPDMRATLTKMYFYMKIAIFGSRLLQNTHQNASITKCF